MCHLATWLAVALRAHRRCRTVRFLEEPPGVRAVAGGDDDGGRHRRREMERASGIVAGSAFLLCASDRRSRSAQNPLMPAISSDTQRRAGPWSALDSPTPT